MEFYEKGMTSGWYYMFLESNYISYKVFGDIHECII